MTQAADAPLTHAHCYNCREDREITTRFVGNDPMYRCTVCGLWIRCMRCMQIRAVTHNCPEQKLIEVPS